MGDIEMTPTSRHHQDRDRDPGEADLNLGRTDQGLEPDVEPDPEPEREAGPEQIFFANNFNHIKFVNFLQWDNGIV